MQRMEDLKKRIKTKIGNLNNNNYLILIVDLQLFIKDKINPNDIYVLFEKGFLEISRKTLFLRAYTQKFFFLFLLFILSLCYVNKFLNKKKT